MGQPQIPSTLGIFRLKGADEKNYFKFGFLRFDKKKYVFAVAERYPQRLEEALIIIYFPIGPSTPNAHVFFRIGDGFEFRKYANIKGTGDPSYHIDFQHFPVDEPSVSIENLTAMIYGNGSVGGVTGQEQRIGLNFERSWTKAQWFSAWEETETQNIRYKVHMGVATDLTNNKRVIDAHAFGNKPPKAKYVIEIMKDKSKGNDYSYALLPEHALPVIAKTTVHLLLTWRYWIGDLNELGLQKKSEEQKEMELKAKGKSS
ncbi:hypothetical protein G7Z17_g4035 [Cylindrodendrum hubeiense]|uniref:Uncharacterized protein n=1 Tax=Cylindrodendrum hubeiense TaxID=595255 RepID=A0A9P5LA90_9HYPO|nr:hypothetical protein G7Z17_g4035 [Cylindrodendrum hubeiense]